MKANELNTSVRKIIGKKRTDIVLRLLEGYQNMKYIKKTMM
ncbi:hypothetical protein [Tepidibacter mesophilus]|nr:hypothetical protein [Tepidibacter mesophilus]